MEKILQLCSGHINNVTWRAISEQKIHRLLLDQLAFQNAEDNENEKKNERTKMNNEKS